MKAVSILLLLLLLPIVSLSQTSSSSEKPTDVEILKFSWGEAPPKTTEFSNRSSDNVFDASGAGSGRTDVERVNRPSLPTSRAKSSIIEYVFTLSIKNTGSKTIQSVRWGYFLYPKDPNAEAVGWLFETRTKIEPGKKKGLKDTSFLGGRLLSKTAKPSNATRSSYNDKAVILHIDYDDGSTWDNPSSYQNIQLIKQ